MMHEQEHKPSAQHDDAVIAANIKPPEPAVEKQPSVEAVPPAASFAELTGQPKAAKTEEQPLSNTDALVEQLAHGMVAKDLDAKDEAFLRVNGYDAMPI